jgi:hypothetical protein
MDGFLTREQPASCVFCGSPPFLSSRIKRSDILTLQDDPIGYPKTSVTNPQPTPRNTPKVRRPHIPSVRQSELQDIPCFAFAVHAGSFTKRLLGTVRLTVNKTSGFSSYGPSVSQPMCHCVNANGRRCLITPFHQR